MSYKYAQNTSVSAEQSRAEIEKLLAKAGASHFMSGWNNLEAQIAFVMHDRQVRFILPVPDPEDFASRETPSGRTRQLKEADRKRLCDQETRRRWRALGLAIKAKLEAVETGITTFDEEFLAHIVVGKSTIGEQMLPVLEEASKAGKLPMLRLGSGK